MGGIFVDAVSWWCMPVTAYCALLFIQTGQLKMRFVIWSLVFSWSVAFTWALLSDNYQVNSLGHVNQSALFAVQAMALAFWLLVKCENSTEKGCVIFVILLSFLYILGSNSLLALGLSIALIGIRILRLIRLNQRMIALSVIVVIGAFSYLEFSGRGDSLVDKIESRLASPTLLSHRDILFDTYIPIVGDALFLGHGVGRYSSVVIEGAIQNKLSITSPEDWNLESPKFLFTGHAHSFYGQILVERGLIGLAILTMRIFRSSNALHEWNIQVR